MAQAWPVGVPIFIERGSLDIQPIDTVLRSSVPVGKAMTRNRYTTSMNNVSWQIQMTKTELDLFYTWYFDVLNRVLTFNFDDPHTAVTTEYSFVSPPTSRHIGGEQYMVSFNLETTP